MIRLFSKNKNLNEVPENWHENFIVEISKVLRPKVYVELGLYKSALFNKMIPYCGKLIGVEIKKELEPFMIKDRKTQFVNMTTDEYAKTLKENPIKIDLIFIDANHSKEQLKKDFNNFFPFVSDNGVILIHDSYPKNSEYTNPGYCGDGYKYIAEISKKRKNFELVTIPTHPGLTIVRKRKKQLGWVTK